jgi:hypothetical protein
VRIPTCWCNCFSSTGLVLIVHICSVAAEKVGPFNSDALSRLLRLLANDNDTADTTSWSQNRQVRSPPCSPPPEGNHHFEAFCHDELVKAGGRRVASFELFLYILDNDANASGKKLWTWLGDVEFVSQDGVMSPIFSTQLEDWEAFRQKWQWDNRGMYASHDGLAAFLESRKKRYLHKGESKVVSDPSFKETARHMELRARHLELPGREGFESCK